MSSQTYANMRAFIVTPFEKKKDAKGNEIDFDEVREKLIEPALDQLGIGGRTTGEIVRAGSIHTDMFQRLLTADLVVAEISIHNANVFYELGIRHALRQHRTFMLRGEAKDGSKNDQPPFDIQGYRFLKYDRDDPAASLDKLVEALRATLDSPDTDSPVFRNLPALKEQERSHFQPVPRQFTEEVNLAQAGGQRGDLAMLALETRGYEWWAGGLRVVGGAQVKLKDFGGGRQTWEQILKVYPDDKDANTQLGTVYQRLGEKIADPARSGDLLVLSDQALDRVVAHQEATPEQRAEAYALQGRNAKTRWVQEWRQYPEQQQREQALRSPYLEASYEACARGFNEDLNHFYSGLNAMAMLAIRVELAEAMPDVWAENFDDEPQATLKLDELKKKLAGLAPSVELSIKAAIDRYQREANATQDLTQRNDKLNKLLWAKISQADHCFLTAKKPEKVKSEYRKCLKDVDVFSRDSVGRQVRLYGELGLFSDNVPAALESIGPPPPEKKPEEQPLVILFTGHRVDEEGREAKGLPKRFPKDKVDVARNAIKEALSEELAKAHGNAIGIAGGASGGDILFHEVCAELNIPTYLYLILPREDYIRESVQPSGDDWVERFNDLYKKNQNKREMAGSMDLPPWLRDKGKEYSIWQRNNLWTLSNAIALDSAGSGANLVLIALWDKGEADGPGGTKDMVNLAEKRGARKRILPTKELFGLANGQAGPA